MRNFVVFSIQLGNSRSLPLPLPQRVLDKGERVLGERVLGERVLGGCRRG